MTSLRSLRLALAAIGALILHSATLAAGGVCWSALTSTGRCKEILSQGVTREQCCGQQQQQQNQGTSALNAASTAYSDEDYDNGALFFWQVLGGGVACDSCRVSCQGVTCSTGKSCVLRRGMPKCVCRPAQCTDSAIGRLKNKEYDGPVCGTDGRTYSNVCKLKRRSCRKGDSSSSSSSSLLSDDDELLSVAYGGQCRSSCLGVRCRHGRSCLLDQNLSAHCVKCARRCTLSAKQSAQLKPVCGVDGQTYKSACHLRAAACRAGRAIAIAYRGPCRADEKANCRNIECRPGQLCLSEPETSRPRCVTCLYRCPRNRELVQQRNRHKNRDYQDSTPLALCATNNITYPSWCHIMKDACLTGMVIETRHAGPCNKDDLAPSAEWKTTTSSNSSLIIIDTKKESSSISSSSNNSNKLKLKNDLKTIIGTSHQLKRKLTTASPAKKKKKKQQQQQSPSVL